MATNADRIVEGLKAAGVDRIFGVPGGGSNADLIEAAGRAGVPFTLAHTETASVFMATAQSDITGRPGACIATLGPGAASLMNGVGNAHLDRVPVILLTDCASNPAMEHQNLPHREMFAPLVKWTGRPRAEEVGEALRCAIDALVSDPPGPVHMDISTEVANAAAQDAVERAAKIRITSPIEPAVAELLGRARRPVFLIGLGARTNEIASAVRSMCEQYGIPALVTYKAKGVLPDRHPWFGGVLTNGSLECEVMERADAFIGVGLDAVELLPRAWKWKAPIISITRWAMKQQQIPFSAELVGDVVALLEGAAEFLPKRTEWDQVEVAKLARRQREKMQLDGEGLRPFRVGELVAEVYPGARVTVDAGAHMFPIMALWPAVEPAGVLISNGLSTMGFALPAAIGAAMLDRPKPVIAFTGDGGLLMCMAELRTAAREELPVRVIVFDDGDLTLIKMKQNQRGYRPDGVAIGELDWCAVARGMGVRAEEAASEDALAQVLRDTANVPGPVLIAAKISTGTYDATMKALRG